MSRRPLRKAKRRSNPDQDSEALEPDKELGNADDSLFLATPKVILTSGRPTSNQNEDSKDIKNENLLLDLDSNIGGLGKVVEKDDQNESVDEDLQECLGLFDKAKPKTKSKPKIGMTTRQVADHFLEDFQPKSGDIRDIGQDKFSEKLQATFENSGQPILKNSFDTFREKSQHENNSMSLTERVNSGSSSRPKSVFTKKRAPAERMTIVNDTSINYGPGQSFLVHGVIKNKNDRPAGSFGHLANPQLKNDDNNLDSSFQFWKKSGTPQNSFANLHSMEVNNIPTLGGMFGGILGDNSFNDPNASILKDLHPIRDLGQNNLSFEKPFIPQNTLGNTSRILDESIINTEGLDISINRPMETDHSFVQAKPFLFDVKNNNNSFNIMDIQKMESVQSQRRSFQDNMARMRNYNATGLVLPVDMTGPMARVPNQPTGDIASRIPSIYLKNENSRGRRSRKGPREHRKKFFDPSWGGISQADAQDQNEANNGGPEPIIEEEPNQVAKAEEQRYIQAKFGNPNGFGEQDILVSSETPGDQSLYSDIPMDNQEMNPRDIQRMQNPQINTELLQTLIESKDINTTEKFLKMPKYRYIWNKYTSQIFQDIVRAKCQEYMQRRSPEILEMINKVVAKNKKWQKVLRAIKEAAESSSSSSESETKVKNSLEIEQNQETQGVNITNNIKINFNTEIRFNKRFPFRHARLMKRKKGRRRKKHRFCKKTRKPEHKGKSRAQQREDLREKGSKSDSDSCDCSNLSDDQTQRQSVKRIKGAEAEDPFKSFISECPIDKDACKGPKIVRVKQKVSDGEPESVVLGKRKNPLEPAKPPQQKPAKQPKKRGRRRKNNGRRRPGRPKKSEYFKMLKKKIRLSAVESDEETSYGTLSLVKRTVFDVLFSAFVKKIITKKEHAMFMNSDKDEAIVVRNILKKKFILAENVRAGDLQMIKPKKRNEEINKFVVKRCFKYLMKKERERSLKNIDEEPAKVNPLEDPAESKTSLNNRTNITQEFSGNQISRMAVKCPSPSNMSSRKSISPSKNILPSDTTRDNRFLKLGFPKQDKSGEGMTLFADGGSRSPKLFTALSPVSDIQRKDSAEIRNLLGQLDTKNGPAKKEEPKIVAHSKILSEHQFYNKYFGKTAQIESQDISEYYLPNTKIANNAIQKNKHCFKTINIKYIKLILKSQSFMESVSLFLKDVFEQEYVATRNDKLLLMSKNINDKKYIKSVKLPWTVHEIHDAKDTFTNIVDSAKKAHNIGSAQPVSGLNTPKKSGKKSAKKESRRKSSNKTDNSVSGRSRASRRRGRARKNQDSENFQACFADSNRSNTFLNK